MAYSANNTTISYKFGSVTTPKPIDFLMEIPELGGAPEKIDVTTLSDLVKQYIPGIKDYGDLIFKFLYENKNEDSNFRVFKKLEKESTPDTAPTFIIKYQDGTTHEFDAIPSVKLDAGAINGALTFSVTMLLQSDIKIEDPTEQ